MFIRRLQSIKGLSVQKKKLVFLKKRTIVDLFKIFQNPDLEEFLDVLNDSKRQSFVIKRTIFLFKPIILSVIEPILKFIFKRCFRRVYSFLKIYIMYTKKDFFKNNVGLFFEINIYINDEIVIYFYSYLIKFKRDFEESFLSFIELSKS